LGIAAVSANARMRMRVISRVSLGGKSVPVGSAKDENKHFEEAERENGPRAVRLSLRITGTRVPKTNKLK
jgi:hypothetical protein